MLANPSHSTIDKSKIFHLDFWDQYFTFDNGKAQNLKIIDKHNIQNNFLQVINQYYSQGDYKNCYDVSIL
ncbi:hypothetical protein LS73_008185 [Helicobacter muridarum]|uniref:Restriction endonuclease type I HsdR N-terminal domain-containing protein n=1 Tax=Helicobacter muridarum TaxID=216 RepID=A0A4U8TFF5_9HELI|nr:hypothetical protein LS73_008185 [Helicobacter muridarum]